MPTGRPVGRPSTPLERKRATGNPGKRRLPERVTTLSVVAPPRPPKGLQRAGKALWRTVWSEAGSWIAPTDAPLVLMLAEAADERAQLRDDVAKHGHTWVSPTGSARLNPSAAQLRAVEAQITAWLSMLGLTPTDRARLGLLEVKARGHLEELQRRKADLDG